MEPDKFSEKERVEEIPNVQDNSDYARVRAATRIQRGWRKGNDVRSQYMDAESRWHDAATHARMKMDRTAQEEGKNDPRTRWKRAVFLATRLQDGDPMLSNAGVEDDSAVKKSLETQHWLELVDAKHRYGSNLKWYHKRWQDVETTDNFFKWLDRGGGKDLSLANCSREQLERERITYLSVEQRLNYLVNIDNDGKLRWARNDEYVDTTAGHWKDEGRGEGIVPQDMPDRPPVPRRGSFDVAPSPPVSPSSKSDKNAAIHYIGGVRGKNRWTRIFKKNFTLHGLMDKLLRKTVKRNTWIYVSDKNFNMFIGIKLTGTFQHSSFLAGGIVTSAGLISVKDGTIHTLSPLSGHYRTSIGHFRKFIGVLEERGVDMHRAEISKAEIALWGIERIGKAKKAQSRATQNTKKGLQTVVYRAADKVLSRSEGSSWKRDILEGRKRRAEERDEGHGKVGQNQETKRVTQNAEAGENPLVP